MTSWPTLSIPKLMMTPTSTIWRRTFFRRCTSSLDTAKIKMPKKPKRPNRALMKTKKIISRIEMQLTIAPLLHWSQLREVKSKLQWRHNLRRFGLSVIRTSLDSKNSKVKISCLPTSKIRSMVLTNIQVSALVSQSMNILQLMWKSSSFSILWILERSSPCHLKRRSMVSIRLKSHLICKVSTYMQVAVSH